MVSVIELLQELQQMGLKNICWEPAYTSQANNSILSVL